MATLLDALGTARGPVTGDGLRAWMAEAGLWHLAEVGGEVLGFQRLGPHPDLPDDTADVATFVIRGRHDERVGSALWNATRAAARAAGWRHAVAVLREDNVGGLAYYQSRGFEVADRIAERSRVDGRIVRKVVWRISL